MDRPQRLTDTRARLVQASLGAGIGEILLLGAEKEMVRPYAEWSVAAVKDFQVAFDGTVRQFPCNTMCIERPTLAVDDAGYGAIAANLGFRNPEPAAAEAWEMRGRWTVLVDFRPESLFNRHADRRAITSVVAKLLPRGVWQELPPTRTPDFPARHANFPRRQGNETDIIGPNMFCSCFLVCCSRHDPNRVLWRNSGNPEDGFQGHAGLLADRFREPRHRRFLVTFDA